MNINKIDKSLISSIIRETVYETMPIEAIERILIFGSTARGDAADDSDIDICIITHKELTYEEIKMYRGKMNRIFAFRHHIPTDILLKSSYELSRFGKVIGAIENEILKDGVAI